MPYKINRYHYIDRKVGIRFVIYARKDEFADELSKRISKVFSYNLRRTRIFFKKEVYTEIPPYELELAQEEYVDEVEERIKSK